MYNLRFIDKNGKIVIPFIYDNAGNFSEGLAAVEKIDGYVYHSMWGRMPTTKCGYIDKNGNIAIPIKLQSFGHTIVSSEFHEGLAVQAVSKHPLVPEKYGYINKKGEWVILPLYTRANEFNKGIAQVEIDEKSGYINHRGDYIIHCEYDKYGGYFVSDSIIKLEKDGVPCYFDIHGKTIENADVY